MPFDFDAAVCAPFRMQPGLRRLAAGAPQLSPLAPGARHQREKLAVLSVFADQAGAGAEVEQLAGGGFGLGDEVVRCLRGLPERWRLAGLLSLAFAEDFAIVDGADGSIPWLAVALPSHWAPEDKIGRPFAEVHAPVADATLVVNAGAALMRMVTGPERWERFVWNVSAHPWLHAHPRRRDPQRWRQTEVGRAWWRTGRQTFIPLPDRRQAVFTIHVQLEALADTVAPPGRAARLHDAIASMSPAVLDYRGLTPVREALLAWLAARR